MASGSGFEHSVTEGELTLACPRNVRCDESFDYHALSYEDERLSVQLFFAPELARHYSLEGFREHFQYANVQFQLAPPPETDTRIIGETTARSPQIEFISYEQARLSLRIDGKGFRKVIEKRSDSPECRTGDIAGRCSEMKHVDAPYAITLDAGTPTPPSD